MLPGAVDYNDELMRQLNGDSDDDDDDDDDDDEVVGASTRRSRASLNHHHHNGHAKTNSPGSCNQLFQQTEVHRGETSSQSAQSQVSNPHRSPHHYSK